MSAVARLFRRTRWRASGLSLPPKLENPRGLRPVPSPDALPIEVRQAAWHRLWQRLLSEAAPADETETGDESAESPTDEEQPTTAA